MHPKASVSYLNSCSPEQFMHQDMKCKELLLLLPANGPVSTMQQHDGWNLTSSPQNHAGLHRHDS